MLNIVFVCTFNRARSVMAAAVLSEQVRRRGLKHAVRVSSAGVSPAAGGQIDPRAARVLEQHAYPVPSDHRGRSVGAECLTADLVMALGCDTSVLLRLGVEAERIRLLDVQNPHTAADYESAFTIIESQMASVHALVDQLVTGRGIDLERLDSAIGWRFWTGRPGDVLRSPFTPSAAAVERGATSLNPLLHGVEWPTRCCQASCHVPGHRAPVDDCLCGWYCDVRETDLYARVAAYKGCWGERIAAVGSCHLVVARLNLSNVIRWRPPLWLKSGNADVEYRAEWACIAELYLYDTIGDPSSPGYAQELADRYQVPVNRRV